MTVVLVTDTAPDVTGQAPVFEFKGEQFEFPTEIPYAIARSAARVARAQETQERAAATGDEAAAERAGMTVIQALDDMVVALFGERYDEFIALNPSMNDVMGIFEHVNFGVGLGESQASGR